MQSRAYHRISPQSAGRAEPELVGLSRIRLLTSQQYSILCKHCGFESRLQFDAAVALRLVRTFGSLPLYYFCQLRLCLLCSVSKRFTEELHMRELRGNRSDLVQNDTCNTIMETPPGDGCVLRFQVHGSTPFAQTFRGCGPNLVACPSFYCKICRLCFY